jgi:hypothetical protein
MIGATFSLWRAVFLLQVKERKWSNILDAGKEFIERVIETNSISFSDEYSLTKRTWVVGYYLNNARFRAVSSIKELQKTNRDEVPRQKRVASKHVPRGQSSLMALRKKLEIGFSEGDRELRAVWDETYDATETIFRHLKGLTPS